MGASTMKGLKQSAEALLFHVADLFLIEVLAVELHGVFDDLPDFRAGIIGIGVLLKALIGAHLGGTGADGDASDGL